MIGERPTRAPRSPRGPAPARPPAASDVADGLAVAVHRVLVELRTRRGPLDDRVTRAALDQLRRLSRHAPDPALRATLQVACAHLGAGDLDETLFALSTAALALRLPGTAAR